MEEVGKFLEYHNGQLCLEDSQVEELIKQLESIGVNKLEDLKFVKKGNLRGIKLSQRKLLLELIENEIKPASQPEFDRDGGTLQDFLAFCQLGDGVVAVLEAHLADLGVDKFEDLVDLSEEDIAEGDTGLVPIEQNRLLQCIKEQLMSPQNVSASQQPKPGAKAKPSPAEPVGELIRVRYIYCSDLFSSNVREREFLALDSGRVNMIDLCSMIGEREGLDVLELTLEMFSREGYPLNVNDVTFQCTLKQWKVKDNDLFYVFPRRKKQPGLVVRKTLPPLDHKIGCDELFVNSQFFGNFSVKADLYLDSAEDIVQKVHSCTKIPTPLICLYARKNVQSLDVYTELFNGDRLTLVLKNPSAQLDSLATTYGKATYNMMEPQSDKGISKFFAILKFLCLKQKETVKFPNLLAYLRKLTNCPPVVYALGVLYDNSVLRLPCWVALIEGFYQLFKAWLAGFWKAIDKKRVFEFSDYFWALIMKKAEHSSDTTMVKLDSISLYCPHSGIKITEPVRVPGSSAVYDKQSVLETIERGEQLRGCEKQHLETGDMTQDNLVARLLLYNPWNTDREVHKWRVVGQSFQKQDFPVLPCQWYELATCLDQLRIIAPDVLFGLGSLTFVEEGRLVIFMGFTKDTETSHTVYDPLKCDYVKRSKKDLSIVKSSSAPYEVHEDLTKLGCQVVHLTKEVLEKARPPPVITTDPQAAADWEPEEAIVVLLDRSGSMSHSIFKRETKGLTRVDAAKIFFGAFALRTQAYNFHHSVGFTAFDSVIESRMAVTKMSPSFEHSLEDISPGGSTELNEAMATAVAELKGYTENYPHCLRRILCLTDGYDTSRHKYYSDPFNIASHLQQAKVVVDTVLIDNHSANVRQKAISQATGGACFMPSTLSEGLNLFEMETFLSLRARALPHYLHPLIFKASFQHFEDTSRYPFNYEQLPSTLFKKVKSLSAKRMLDKQDVFDSKGETSECTHRVMNEIRGFFRNPVPHIDIFPSEQSMTTWKVLMKGPDNTPYAGGVFVLQVLFTDDYPAKPPNVRFETEIYHCNINSYGRICHQVFTLGYSPSLTMRDILACVYGLLMCPEPSDPLDSVKGLELFNSMREEAQGCDGQSAYKKAAKEHTAKYARRNDYRKLFQNLSGE